MTLRIESANMATNACPYCGQSIVGRVMHVNHAGRCTIVELGPVYMPKANYLVGPLDRCPHCFDAIAEGTMHTRQTGGRCTVTHVMRREP